VIDCHIRMDADADGEAVIIRIERGIVARGQPTPAVERKKLSARKADILDTEDDIGPPNVLTKTEMSS
jgi:hypothetical protein